MKGVLRRYRSLPIRSRLALLVAAAVAFAVAAVSVTCWFIVQGRLYDQVNDDLGQARMKPGQWVEMQNALTNCTQSPEGSKPFRNLYSQVVKADGTPCVTEDSIGAVKVTQADKDVIKNGMASRGIIRNGTADDGTPLRVMTVPQLAQNAGTGEQTYVAITIAVSLEGTKSTLNDLALVLLLVSGIGVIGAGAAGLAVARAGLRPVDKLTEAVEHVARTEDLNIRIPVEDDSEDEVARLSRSFNSMTSALASSHELQQQLIADAGHELRTPLTSLRTNIELLTRSEETGRPIPEADRKALLASVKAQMTELASLIGDLQELSRSEGQRGERVQVISLEDTVESALRRARLRGPELTISADLQPWYVRAEPAALERAVVNVLDNAVKFSPEGGTIEVALTDGVLTVRDHGPGIPADELPHVFDRFWRSPSARALPGSGLGLSIVARTVEQAGGQVTLARAEGGGTVATVRLPGAPTPPPAEPQES
ncbi:histidine kinase [Streptomyces viridochromogenes]|uniref:histidine kinase n=1 Tax=Streptomyces viridochromogenes TaxID=1938 RepID=A0A0J7YZW3_STRVR|nr:HAMP domain-containing sensor histidine kinase [Streptomyces viridochromogenes]KMS69251.1 histidine kinase [Streptomyces viridochromogenes]KOG15764.1 histidine kinase [Streptomyces viridochromogenes]KOG21355.1 histidine kinase [Streptomyces viridochromogenes]